MSAAASRVSERAAQLRRDFDRGFAEPVRFDPALKVDLLAISIGGQACAIRLSEISGLHAGKEVTSVPGGHAALLGIAGFRGVILPVYDLAAVLGSAGAQTPRWLVIARSAPAALAFETFSGQLSVSPQAILPQRARGEMQSCAREFLRMPEFSGPILHLPSVLEAIGAAGAAAAPKQE